MTLQSMRDAPGTQREYETIFIMRADAATENIQEVNTRVRKIIEERGGKVLRVDNWGKRKLAYEIAKQLKGIYLYWQYLGAADMVTEIERNLRMLDLVIRYQSVRVDANIDPNARPSQLTEETFLAAATTVPDEEDTYMGRGLTDDGSEEDEYGERVTDDEPVEMAPVAPTGEVVEAEEPAAEEPVEEPATDDAKKEE
jgi:small subunit ribosomal protein S6